MNITLSGSNTFQTGGLQAPYAIGAGGVNDYWSLQPGNTEEWSVRRNAAYDALLAQSQSHLFSTNSLAHKDALSIWVLSCVRH